MPVSERGSVRGRSELQPKINWKLELSEGAEVASTKPPPGQLHWRVHNQTRSGAIQLLESGLELVLYLPPPSTVARLLASVVFFSGCLDIRLRPRLDIVQS